MRHASETSRNFDPSASKDQGSPDRAQDRIRIEAEAVLTILGRYNEDWTLVGSEAIDFELSAVTDQKKRSDAFLLSSLAKEKTMVDKSIIKGHRSLKNLANEPWMPHTFHVLNGQQILCLRLMMMMMC